MTDVPTVAVPADLLLRLSMPCHEVPVLYEVQDLESQEHADAAAIDELFEEQAPDWYERHEWRLVDAWLIDHARAAHIAWARGLFPTVEYRPDDAVSVLARESET